MQVFNVPRGHHKSKPFIDHILAFYIVDNRIWFRNFQVALSLSFFLRALAQRGRSAPPRSCQTILSNAWPLVQIDNMNESKNSEPVLAEVGPRFVLNPIRIFGVRPARMGTTLSREAEHSVNSECAQNSVRKIDDAHDSRVCAVAQGSFGGPTLWQNQEFIPPNQVSRHT